MKIVIVSDSHGDTEILNQIKLREYDADYFIHCGDFCIPEYLMDGWAHVSGNCDWGLEGQRELNISTPIGKIHVEHGDNIRMMMNIEKYLQETNCKLFVFGHTHVRQFTKYKDSYLINPGSLTRPRDSEFGSFLILEIDEENKKIVPHFMSVELHENCTYKEDKKVL